MPIKAKRITTLTIMLIAVVSLLLPGCMPGNTAEQAGDGDEVHEIEDVIDEEVDEADDVISEEDEQGIPVPEGATAVIEEFWAAFAAADYETAASLMAEEPEREADLSLYHLATRAHIPYDSHLIEKFQGLDISVLTSQPGEGGLVVTVRIEHPLASPSMIAAASEAFKDLITDASERGERADLHEIYRQILEDVDTMPGHTEVEALVREMSGEWRITRVESPGKIFSSFHQLHRDAVCDPMGDPVITLSADNRLHPQTPVDTTFAGRTLTIDARTIPDCRIRGATIMLADERTLPVVGIIDALSEAPLDWKSLDFYLQMGPEDFLHEGTFTPDPQENRVAFVLSRPYALATLDSAIGYAIPDSSVIEVLEVVPGSVEHLAWSPDTKYLAVAWWRYGKGGTDVHVFSMENHDRLSFSEMRNEEHHVHPITDLMWSQDSTHLLVDVQEDGKPITWRLDVQEGIVTQEAQDR